MPADLEHAQDVLVAYLEKLPKHARVAVLRACDSVSLYHLTDDYRR